MLSDLDRLIRLQQIETSAEEARRTITDHPLRVQALEARLADATASLDAVRQRLADSQTARRIEEKDLATVQARLAKYKGQLLDVKTNREYQAMQHEIAAAQTEVSRREDQILERMLEADELGKAIRQAEAELAKVSAEVTAERTALDQQVRQLEAELDLASASRTTLVAEITPSVAATFETVARGRKGIAVAEARDGLCTLCHVRLRPQVFNEVRRNDAIIQCDSCQRILFFAGPAADRAAALPREAAGAPSVPSR